MGTMQKHEFEAVLSRHDGYRPQTYIETGLMSGDRIFLAASCFKVLHGIELDSHWYEVSRGRVSQFPHVMVHKGDSRLALPHLLKIYAETPCFIYLDAHYCKTDPPIQKSEFPLWAELGEIKKKKTKDIVVVDDIHTFGKQRPELRFKPDAKEWDGVTIASLIAYFGDQVQHILEIADSFVIWRDGTSGT